jgi:hypothetical protein
MSCRLAISRARGTAYRTRASGVDLPPVPARCRPSAASPKFAGSGHSRLLQTKSRRVPSFRFRSQARLIRRKSWLLGTDKTYSYSSVINSRKVPNEATFRISIAGARRITAVVPAEGLAEDNSLIGTWALTVNRLCAKYLERPSARTSLANIRRAFSAIPAMAVCM